MTESFLGVTARMYDPSTKSTRSITLACRTFPTPHTANKVSELVIDILREWEIPNGRISAIVIDNGSNMVAAFKWINLDTGDDDDSDDIGIISDEEELVNVGAEVAEYMDFGENCRKLFASQ